MVETGRNFVLAALVAVFFLSWVSVSEAAQRVESTAPTGIVGSDLVDCLLGEEIESERFDKIVKIETSFSRAQSRFRGKSGLVLKEALAGLESGKADDVGDARIALLVVMPNMVTSERLFRNVAHLLEADVAASLSTHLKQRSESNVLWLLHGREAAAKAGIDLGHVKDLEKFLSRDAAKAAPHLPPKLAAALSAWENEASKEGDVRELSVIAAVNDHLKREFNRKARAARLKLKRKIGQERLAKLESRIARIGQRDVQVAKNQAPAAPAAKTTTPAAAKPQAQAANVKVEIFEEGDFPSGCDVEDLRRGLIHAGVSGTERAQKMAAVLYRARSAEVEFLKDHLGEINKALVQICAGEGILDLDKNPTVKTGRETLLRAFAEPTVGARAYQELRPHLSEPERKKLDAFLAARSKSRDVYRRYCEFALNQIDLPQEKRTRAIAVHKQHHDRAGFYLSLKIDMRLTLWATDVKWRQRGDGDLDRILRVVRFNQVQVHRFTAMMIGEHRKILGDDFRLCIRACGRIAAAEARKKGASARK